MLANWTGETSITCTIWIAEAEKSGGFNLPLGGSGIEASKYYGILMAASVRRAR